ncbi:hypothetical protein, partial [Burkholderia pseudomallei]|uniref:hypothetical protein n=1 Tax=Burkholderia pseudomallei TaxID=28450 RepID=UPI001F2029DC
TISSSCCVGMGVFSITPLKNKNPALGEGLSAIWSGPKAASKLADIPSDGRKQATVCEAV